MILDGLDFGITSASDAGTGERPGTGARRSVRHPNQLPAGLSFSSGVRACVFAVRAPVGERGPHNEIRRCER